MSEGEEEMKKKINKETKKYKAKELRKLRNKCLKLWSEAVKCRAGYKCEWSGETEHLNSHHIEGYRTNANLRYDVRNGLCVTAGHHKFKAESADNSFCFIFSLMWKKRKEDLKYLLKVWREPVREVTKEFLEEKIKELSGYLITGKGYKDISS